jgi:lysophospholipase L1-like esterase
MMKIQTGSRLLMIGDSITDANRVRPVGERAFSGLGAGYVSLVDSLLGAFYPAHDIRVINVGISGNTVRDLKARWQTDVTDLKPDWLSVMIGINDVWRQFDSPLQTEWHVLPDEYRSTLQELAARTRPSLTGLVLMTPYYMEPGRTDAMRAMMDRYGSIVRDVATATDAVFVDTQAAMDAVLAHYYPGTLGWDRVHPNQLGHMVLARAFLEAVGFEWR